MPVVATETAAGFTRRTVLLGAAALAAPLRATPPPMGLAEADPALDPALREQALAALARHHRAIWSRDVIGVIDFAQPSSAPRFHIVDILAGRTTALRVAHGKGSDPDHLGRLTGFSNLPGSNATSAGAYLIGEAYAGVHGRSRRLLGLDPENSAAEARAIVIHPAWYMADDVVARQGWPGRSDGCFAVAPADIGFVLAKLGTGRLLYAGLGAADSGQRLGLPL